MPGLPMAVTQLSSASALLAHVHLPPAGFPLFILLSAYDIFPYFARWRLSFLSSSASFIFSHVPDHLLSTRTNSLDPLARGRWMLDVVMNFAISWFPLNLPDGVEEVPSPQDEILQI